MLHTEWAKQQKTIAYRQQMSTGISEYDAKLFNLQKKFKMNQ